MRKVVVVCFSSLVLFSCGEKQTKKDGGEVVSTIAAGGQSEKELKESLKEYEKEEADRIAEEKRTNTTMKFDKARHDYGDVKPNTDNLCKFEVFNTGKNPLILESVTASCGCTTPKKPEKPILPGKSDFIEVNFHPKPGQKDEIVKSITIVANTSPKITELEIRAFVK